MQPHVKLSAADFSGEVATMSLGLPNITNANFENYRDTVIGNLVSALAGITLCEWDSWQMFTEVYTDVGTLPSSPYAQRELRALFTCVDTGTGKKFVVGIPCPDLADMAIAGTDVINLANVEVAAYVAAVELHTVSPQGNAVSVISGKLVGRNL